eukprot:01781_6
MDCSQIYSGIWSSLYLLERRMKNDTLSLMETWMLSGLKITLLWMIISCHFQMASVFAQIGVSSCSKLGISIMHRPQPSADAVLFLLIPKILDGNHTFGSGLTNAQTKTRLVFSKPSTSIYPRVSTMLSRACYPLANTSR